MHGNLKNHMNNTFMKTKLIILTALSIALLFPAHAQNNALTQKEKSTGWRLLFDGQTTTGWRGFQKSTFPEHGWVVEDGCLKCLGQKGGDIITTMTFTNFELTWEWRLSPQGNSGVKYFVDEKRADSKGKLYSTAIAHEYQMIDDDNYSSPLSAKQKTGSFYEVIAPQNAQPKPIGEFNQSRLIVSGNKVEHWLNGKLVVSYQTTSAEVVAGIATSKFKNVLGFADKIPTPILLQDHTTMVWFRNLKLHEISTQ